MSYLLDSEIEEIKKTYKETKSIVKTAKLVNKSRNTVNKYVRQYSSNDIHSRNCKNEVQQIDLNTGKVIKVWYKPSIAAKALKIDPSEICLAMQGKVKQAGNFAWKAKTDEDN